MVGAQAAGEPLTLRLARYLKEFVGLRTTTIRELEKYESHLWLHEMPQDGDCRSPAWTDDPNDEAAWLEVRKQQFPRPPEAPAETAQWIDADALKKASVVLPPLLQSIFVPDPEAVVEADEAPPLIARRLEDHPAVAQAYETFRPAWEAWSKEYRRRQSIQSVYAELFRLHTQIRKAGEILELVLGFGLVEWNPGSQGKSIRIRRHAITASVDLHFDAASGVIRLRPASDGANLRLEDDMLDAELRPERGSYSVVKEQLEELGEAVWDSSRMHVILRAWAGSLHPHSQWSPELKPLGASLDRPAMSFAPALILRPRSQAGMLRIYEALIQRLSSGVEEVPPGWRALVQDEEDVETNAWSDAPDEPGAGRTPERREVFFPLPANREQREIVKAIDQRRGVLVQGPPGTGKSHTIANLVCHLLATGKRVLITAETGRALEVLKAKLPEQIQPLCVSLLGQGTDAFAELNSAIQGITSRQASYSPSTYQERIADLEQDLDMARRKIAAIDTELRSLREDETCQYTLVNGAYQGTASQIAERIATERQSHRWLQIPRDADESPPLPSEELTAWLAIRRNYDEGVIADANLQLIASRKLPSPADFAIAVATEEDARLAVDALAHLRDHPAYEPILRLSPDARTALAVALRDLEISRRALDRRSGDWLKRALKEVLEGRQAIWHALHERSIEVLDRIERLLDRLGTKVVSIPEARDLRVVRSDAMAAAAHLESGGKWTRLGLMTPKPLKARLYLREEIRVDGADASTPELLRTVCDHADLATAFSELKQVWAAHGDLPDSHDPKLRLVAIKEQLSTLREALVFGERCIEQTHTMATAAWPIPEPDWLSEDSKAWIQILDAAGIEERHQKATASVELCLGDLRALYGLHDAHPLNSALVRSVEKRSVTEYSEAHASVLVVEQTRRDQTLRSRIEDKLEQTIPGFASAVAASLSDSAWDERFAQWEAAWQWAVAENWLGKRNDLSYQQGLHTSRRDAESTANTILADAAALRAWKFFFERLSAPEASALRGWREAVKAMGKGTGRSARQERLRRDARTYMDKCRDAIPVWIMPRFLLAEMLEPAAGRYDIVIVDEASQLGVESLFLFYIAKKMVVVGDDQQISPYGVGISDEAIAGLQHHHLQGMPHRVALSPQSSLYSNARIRFQQNIVLREHFRCMPEIIQFSNDLCYASNGTPLDPLRAYPPNRLKPLVVRHVVDGYRTGNTQNAINPPEAEAIVAQIAACIEDPRYAGCSMGVISLQGEAQAKLIERKLLDALEPEVIEERRLICGDAYAFQGDERHVIFLSMVAAPGEVRIGALSTDSARQRFNVAASRAQDQLWLFHSATLDVLSESCMRHKLLSYMQNPARAATRSEDQVFDSKFERDVFRHLTDRGFHVRAQVCVGDRTNHRYRIDLVVEGMQGRLAVECDGDQWHGPDRYEQDMARQRDLERAGWQFARIRGGDFYRDQGGAMDSIWTELDRLGIRPGGIDEAAAEPPSPADRAELTRHDAESSEEADEIAPEAPEQHSPQPHRTSAPGSDSARGDEVGSKQSGQAPATRYVRDEVAPTSGVAVRAAGDGPDTRTEPIGPLISVSGTAHRADTGPASTAYVTFDGRAGPDPRTANSVDVAKGLTRIIEIEGPVCAKRAYDIYLRGCGIKRLGGEIQKAMNRALNIAIREGKVAKEDERGTLGLFWSVVRVNGTAPVKVRERGPRTFDEIPPSELQLVARRVAKNLRVEPESEAHLRAVLECFDLVRLTPQVSAGLHDALTRHYAYVDLLLANEES